jgi:transcriptional regulator with XRE-family HTH domain
MTPNYHQRLRAAREAAGYTLDDVLTEMRTRLPRALWTSKGTLQRIETEVAEDRVDIHLVAFLCALYERPVEYVSPAIAVALADYRRAVDHLATHPGDRPYRSRSVSSRCISPIEQPPLPGFPLRFAQALAAGVTAR